MNDTERAAWDRRYREGTHQSLTPDSLLVSAYEEFIAPGFPQSGRCLDLAGGVGRHAIFLAERGWDVTLLEISPAGLDIAKHEVAKRGLHIVAAQADLAETTLPTATFDLILNFFYLERTLLSQIAAALKLGGLLIFKTYTRDQLRLGGGPSHPMHLLESNELLRAFAGFRILHYHESLKDKAVAELVARKE
jgi:tellurite methyltransferase